MADCQRSRRILRTRKLRHLVLLLCPGYRPQRKGAPFPRVSFSGIRKRGDYSAPSPGSRNPVEGGPRPGKSASFRASDLLAATPPSVVMGRGTGCPRAAERRAGGRCGAGAGRSRGARAGGGFFQRESHGARPHTHSAPRCSLGPLLRHWR